MLLTLLDRILGAKSRVLLVIVFCVNCSLQNPPSRYREPKNDDLIEILSSTSSLAPMQYYRVLTWNIYKGRKKYFDAEFTQLAADAHFLILQEMTTEISLISILQRNSLFKWAMAPTFSISDNVETGVATASRFQHVDSLTLTTPDLEPFVKTPKAALITKYRIDRSAEYLLIVNIHGINFRRIDALQRQLLMIEDQLRVHRGPILFAGDFNTKTRDRLELLRSTMSRNGLIEVPWHNPPRGEVLDHAFTRGLIVNNAFYRTELRGSDHPALSFDFAISNPTQ